MRLFGRLLMLSVRTPGPGRVNVRAASGPPCVGERETQPHTFRAPEKQSSLKALGLLLLSCRLCCLEVRIKGKAVGLVRLQKTGPLVFFRVVGAHVSRQKGGVKSPLFTRSVCKWLN